jgi:hypothetical protein
VEMDGRNGNRIFLNYYISHFFFFFVRIPQKCIRQVLGARRRMKRGKRVVEFGNGE